MRAAMIISWCYPRIVSLPFAKGRIEERRQERQMRKAERCAVTHPCFETCGALRQNPKRRVFIRNISP